MNQELLEIHEIKKLLELDFEDVQIFNEVQEEDVSMIEDLVGMSEHFENSDMGEMNNIIHDLEEIMKDELVDSNFVSDDAEIMADILDEAGKIDMELPSSNLAIQNKVENNIKQVNNSIQSLGIDEKLVNYYLEKGLKSLYDWQYECITQPGVLQGRNLVYSAPTSGGKTLVSELLMYKRVLEGRRAALVVFPFVSLVSEKKDSYYRAGGEVCGLRISEFHYGSKSPLFEEFDIGVATIEKANALISYYIQHGILFKRLGIIVVDELHLLGDEQRGYILEVMLTKVRLLSKLQGEGRSIQIVGMSATLPNLKDIGLWLDAVVYQSDFRPVPLREYIVIKGKAYIKPAKDQNKNTFGSSLEDTLNRVKSWDFHQINSKFDPNDFNVEQINSNKWKYPIVGMNELLTIGWEALKKGESVLVFCPSKYSVESTALFFAKCIRRQFCEGIDLEGHSDRQQIIQSLRSVERQRFLLAEEIRQNSSISKKSNQNNFLVECIIKGIGFHHSGLSHIERRIVERGYRNGTLSLLTATSTLAAGVNLPSKRVIFRGINIGRSFLTCVDYKQMSGRAGRAGQKGAFGESFILVNETPTELGKEVNEEVENALGLITADMKPLMSSFFTNSNGITRLILEILAILFDLDLSISGNRDKNVDKGSYTGSILDLLTESTLMSHQIKLYNDLSQEYLRSIDSLERALNYLVENKMIVNREKKTNQISIGGYTLNCCCTSLGKAIVSSGLSPSTGLELYDELKKNMESTFLGDLTFMSYLVTPFPPSETSNGSKLTTNNAQPFFRLDWKVLYDNIKEMSILERHSLIRLGFDLEQISWASQLGEENLPPKLKEPGFLRRHQRLFASQILKSVLCGLPVELILSKFKYISVRDLQQLHTGVLSMCISCISFCQNMNWSNMLIIFQNYLRQIQTITLLEEYSGILTRDQNLEKAAKKLISGVKGLSILSALELRSTLSVKTPNQFLMIPRKILSQSINSRIYSGGIKTFQFVSDFVNNVFNNMQSSKKVPFYNRSLGVSNISPGLIFSVAPIGQDFENNENNNFSNLGEKYLSEIETNCILEALSEYDSFNQQTKFEGDNHISYINKELPILTECNLNSFDLENDDKILDMLQDDLQDNIDWEERLLLWSTPLQQSQEWES
ncbi:SFII DNA polymerase [Cryptosporidium ubiquitum]|uniref:SFII DNA polymerase n=1 Tax=Cryptosporidium ubiquitum TaxID=857276 RepID=A0A1J4MB18_9CRYT|nr:SFII DNA polymerase [Cryptosporidium ubiquitum]OII71417.1 SFII DNA polymerase [Cryptosporidium ubiquitum]